MYLNTSPVAFVLLTLLITATLSERTSKSPRYLFSAQSNIIDEVGEETFLASQDEKGRDDISRFAESAENSHRSRFRRASPRNPSNRGPPPVVKASKGLCDHQEFSIWWTEDSMLTAKGSIVAICRDKSKPPKVFVSYDHGLNWLEVTKKFVTLGTSIPWVEKYYVTEQKPEFIIFTDKKNKRIFYTHDGLKTVMHKKVGFIPDAISINPKNPLWVIAADTSTGNDKIYVSKDGSKTYDSVKFEEINAYYWGSKEYGDNDTDIFVEGKVDKNSKFQGYKLDCSGSGNCIRHVLTDKAPLNGDITDFLVLNEYMFCTKENAVKNGVELYVNYRRISGFVKADVRTRLPMKELFIYDVSGGVVMLVANLRKNETNLYTSLDPSGRNYSLSLPRVLYHNPNTEVSSHWLRRAVAFRFVDITRVNGLPSVYFATQLTQGPVGARYLKSMVTFNKGGYWQQVQGPQRTKYGQLCFYPTCSLHVNLFYGSIYRYSRTTPLMSRKSAPGLIMTTGVLGRNLKITPDTYLSTNGGKLFQRVLSGKRRFAFGDHGGIIVASDFSRSQYLQYSYDYKKFDHVKLHSKTVEIKQILTQPGEKGAVFLVKGTVDGNWTLFLVNATSTLGSPCTKADFQTLNVSEVGVGGCEVKQIEVRNTSSRCLVGKAYSRVTSVSYEKCFCRRKNYKCDLNFRPTTTGGCRLIDGFSLIPKTCREGSSFMKSRGYARIEGHNCKVDGISQTDYEPVKAPCPVTRLASLSVTTSPKINKAGIIPIVLGGKISVTANAVPEFLNHLTFKWYVDGSQVSSGVGAKYKTLTYAMNKLGPILLSVSVSNQISSVQETIAISVRRKLDARKVQLKISPTFPSVGEAVIVVVDYLKPTTLSDFGVVGYSWKVEDFHPKARTIMKNTTQSGILKMTFKTKGEKQVTVHIHNGISHITKSVHFTVTKDWKVRNVRLRAFGNKNLYVQWDKVDAPSKSIVRYRVHFRKVDDAVYTEAPFCGKASLTCVIANVTAYTTYQVFVDTVTTTGYGPPSEIKTLRTPAVAPTVPTNVRFINEGPVKLEASWDPPLLPNGKLTGYKYKLYKSGKTIEVKTVATSITKKVFDNLTSDEDYLFEVASVNSLYTGPYSEAKPARTGVGKPTQPPTNILTFQITTNTAQLTWTPPKISKDSEVLFSPKGYNIYRIEKDKETKVGSTPDPKYKFENLTTYTRYTFAIAAYVSSGEGPKAKISFITLLGPPPPPTDFKAGRVSSRKASFSWSPQGDTSRLVGYNVYQLSPLTEHKPLMNVTKPRVTVTELFPNTRYVFAVTAFNAGMESDQSDNATITTKEEKPGKPRKVRVTFRWPGSSSVRVTWEDPDETNGIITSFKVTWLPDNDKSKKKQVTVSKRMLDIDHLRQNTKYFFHVTASTKIGEGPRAENLTTTGYYPFGSRPISILWEKENAAAILSKKENFEMKFINKVVSITKIRKERIADVHLDTKGNSVKFELISMQQVSDLSQNDIVGEMEKIVTALSPSFEVDGFYTKPDAVKSGLPRTGESTKSKTSSSNITVIIAVVCVCAVVIIVLVAALVILFRRYRHGGTYNKFDNQFQYNHDDDTVRSIQSDGDNDVEFHPTSNKHRNKDIETVPLADADELT